jgi:hypothetical protein
MKIAMIGSRDASPVQLATVRELSERFARKGHIIITGGAKGVDSAAMNGAARAGVQALVYYPWPGYKPGTDVPHRFVAEPQPDWAKLAAGLHPKWASLSPAAQKLHARNVGIVEKADVVLAWPNPSRPGGGGTGMGIRIADKLGIPCLTLRLEVADSIVECLRQGVKCPDCGRWSLVKCNKPHAGKQSALCTQCKGPMSEDELMAGFDTCAACLDKV